MSLWYLRILSFTKRCASIFFWGGVLKEFHGHQHHFATKKTSKNTNTKNTMKTATSQMILPTTRRDIGCGAIEVSWKMVNWKWCCLCVDFNLLGIFFWESSMTLWFWLNVFNNLTTDHNLYTKMRWSWDIYFCEEVWILYLVVPLL